MLNVDILKLILMFKNGCFKVDVLNLMFKNECFKNDV